MTARKVPKNQVPSELVDNQDNIVVTQDGSNVTARQQMRYPAEPYDGDEAIESNGYFEMVRQPFIVDINTGEPSAVGVTLELKQGGSTVYSVTVDETRVANYRSLYGVGDGHVLMPVEMTGDEPTAYDVTITSGGKTASLTLTYVQAEP